MSSWRGTAVFIPVRLVQLEYLGGAAPKPKSKQEAAEDARYQNVQDFAFFAANFGYSKAEYMELTPAEKRFLLKAYEEKVVSDSTLLAAAVANAVGNVLRKRAKAEEAVAEMPPACRPAGTAAYRRSREKIEATEGKAWVDLIYQANGMRRRKAVNTDA